MSHGPTLDEIRYLLEELNSESISSEESGLAEDPSSIFFINVGSQQVIIEVRDGVSGRFMDHDLSFHRAGDLRNVIRALAPHMFEPELQNRTMYALINGVLKQKR